MPTLNDFFSDEEKLHKCFSIKVTGLLVFSLIRFRSLDFHLGKILLINREKVFHFISSGFQILFIWR
jgi:hypothetical protein